MATSTVTCKTCGGSGVIMLLDNTAAGGSSKWRICPGCNGTGSV
jgi:DnaJ-class molecular chaperone